MIQSKVSKAFNNISFLQKRQDNETVKRRVIKKNSEIKRACYKGTMN